jgi:hypothetical protein
LDQRGIGRLPCVITVDKRGGAGGYGRGSAASWSSGEDQRRCRTTLSRTRKQMAQTTARMVA